MCAAGDGVGASEAVCAAAAAALELPGGAESVLPCSTGVIGWGLPVAQMVDALPGVAAGLQGGSALPAARAIMTTDRYPKVRAAAACGGRLVGFAKGAAAGGKCPLPWSEDRAPCARPPVPGRSYAVLGASQQLGGSPRPPALASGRLLGEDAPPPPPPKARA